MASKTKPKSTAPVASSWWAERNKILASIKTKPARARPKIKKAKTKAKPKRVQAKRVVKTKKVIKMKKATKGKKGKAKRTK